ncbi:unnamed protein product [Prorocentrum cordatum]|uniref:Uncharacterized protein n=1 Tax=Prorocentrum cordatum TaxID=2364126 RepID=A0ABN9PY86_9DINO|nr:unnamed protein product [Polarella glacialis]
MSAAPCFARAWPPAAPAGTLGRGQCGGPLVVCQAAARGQQQYFRPVRLTPPDQSRAGSTGAMANSIFSTAVCKFGSVATSVYEAHIHTRARLNVRLLSGKGHLFVQLESHRDRWKDRLLIIHGKRQKPCPPG